MIKVPSAWYPVDKYTVRSRIKDKSAAPQTQLHVKGPFVIIVEPNNSTIHAHMMIMERHYGMTPIRFEAAKTSIRFDPEQLRIY